jgi:glucose/arabinose dehydrogenase
MRRRTAILTVCLCAVAGCRGGAAQEPYDGMLAAAQRPVTTRAVPAPQVPQAEPTASEVDVPWAIALLSDAKATALGKPGKVIIVDSEPESPEMLAHDADLHVAGDPASAVERPATPKTCSGVVKSRS